MATKKYDIVDAHEKMGLTVEWERILMVSSNQRMVKILQTVFF